MPYILGVVEGLLIKLLSFTMLKLLHVVSTMDPKLGGVSQAIRSMICGLENEGGVANEVVAVDAVDSPFISEDSFSMHAMGAPKGPLAFHEGLCDWLRKNLGRFDVVIAHGIWQYHSYAVSRALRDQRRAGASGILPRFYVMPHGMMDPYFQCSRSRRFKALRNTLYWKAVESRAVTTADGMLFTCEDEMILARRPFRPYAPKRECVIGLGVEDPPSFSREMEEAFRAKCPDLGEQPYLLFLSRIDPKKGVDLLIRAYAMLLRKSSGNNTPQLVIAGPLDSPYGAAMGRLASELIPGGGQVHFPGILSGDAKFGAFYGCEAFVLPSHQENFGIAVVEALACAKAVLISNKVNIWREIVEGGGGIATEDDEAGVECLLNAWMKMSHTEKQAMGMNARRVFIASFTTRRASKRLLAAVQENAI